MTAFRIQSDRSLSENMLSLRRRFTRSLAWLAFTVVASTIIFALIDQTPDMNMGVRVFMGLWHTLNIVSTIGSLGELTKVEQAWSLLVVIFGLAAVLYGFSSMQALIHGGDVQRYYERRKMKNTLDTLDGHIIVCGYGRVGQAVAEDFKRSGRTLVVIDESPEAAAAADEHDHLSIEADCTKEETLKEAGVERAAGLVAAMSGDAANVYLTLIARALNPQLRIVSRADREETRPTLLRAGVDRVIVPSELAALQLAHMMLKPTVSEFISASSGEGEYDFAEFSIDEHPGFSGKTLGELDFPGRAGTVVISIVSSREGAMFNPPANRQLQHDDTLILVCQEGGLERVGKLETELGG